MSWLEIVAYYIDWLEGHFGMPSGLLRRIAAKESGGGNFAAINPNAYNYGSQASGIFQITPITVAEIRRLWGISIDPKNPVHATIGAALYLAYLGNKFQDWRLAVMAYNWGPGNVNKYLKYARAGYNYPVPAETRNYLAYVIG